MDATEMKEAPSVQAAAPSAPSSAPSSSPSSSPSSAPTRQERGSKSMQVFGAMAANLFAVCMGTTMGWTSAANRLKYPVDQGGLGLSEDSYSWIGATMPLGALVAAIPAGIAMERWGRKRMLLLLSPVVFLAWLLIIFAQNAWMIILARFIIGAAIGSISMIAPLYTKEIAQDSIRGTLSSLFQFLHTCGVLFAYILGAVITDLMWISVICACVPVVAGGLFLVGRFPDTPAWCLAQGDETGAKRALSFFRSGVSDKDLEEELDVIRADVNRARESKSRTFKETLNAFTTREAKMGLMLSMTLMLVQQLSGVSAVIFYASKIFSDAGSSLTGDQSSIAMGACLAGATMLSLYLVEKMGRKLLLLISGVACIICNVVLGSFLYVQHNSEKGALTDYGFIPIVTMSLFMILFSIGYGPIPWGYMTEVFTADIQGTAISIATITNWLMVFIVTLFYAPLSLALGSYTTFWIFGGIVLAGTLVVFFFLVETKGRSSAEIQRLLRGEGRDTDA